MQKDLKGQKINLQMENRDKNKDWENEMRYHQKSNMGIVMKVSLEYVMFQAFCKASGMKTGVHKSKFIPYKNLSLAKIMKF